MNSSYVHVLTNQAMPALVKFFLTTAADPETWVLGLYTMGVPSPFDLGIRGSRGDFINGEDATDR